jgi:hypothetical protein
VSDQPSSRHIIARQEEEAQLRRQEQQEAVLEGRKQLALATAWDAVAYSIEPGGCVRDPAAAVKAVASLHHQLQDHPRKGDLLDPKAGPPAGVEGEDLDAWQVAVDILRSAPKKPAEARQLLGAIHGLPFAFKVRDWLVQGFRLVAEGRWQTGPLCVEIIRPAAATPGAVSEPPKLSRRQRSLLRIMAQKNATSSEGRWTREALVRALRLEWKPDRWAAEFSALHHRDLTAGEPGQAGGVWLTPGGVEVARQLPDE